MKIKVKAGSENVLSEQPLVVSLINRRLEAFHRERILCTDIDVSVVGVCCDCSDQHTLDDTVRFPLHHGAVHKCTRIALVTIADDIFFFLLLIKNLLPFASGRKSAATASAQTGLGDLIDDLLGTHIKQCLCNGAVTAKSNIFGNALGVDASAVFKGDTRLLFIKWNIFLLYIGFETFVLINKAVYHLVMNNTFLDDLLAVLELYLQIKPPHWLDPKKWSHLTEAVASAFL